MPFVDDTCLVVYTGMTGATMNLYTGLADFADCSLLLHMLSSQDLFVDIGSNVGVYTVLAAGVRKAHAVAIEPVPDTYRRMLMNVSANRIGELVEAHNIGLGRAAETMRFTCEGDATNHVITDPAWSGKSVEVQVRRLDDVLADKAPTLIKIDVEGWESEVLAGGDEVLAKGSLLGLIIEMNGSSAEFSPNERAVHDAMLRHDFAPYSYSPFDRKLVALPSKNVGSPNTIYLRDLDAVRRQITMATPFRINGHVV